MMRDFNSQALVNTAWAFATVGHKEEQLSIVLAAATEQAFGLQIQNFCDMFPYHFLASFRIIFLMFFL